MKQNRSYMLPVIICVFFSFASTGCSEKQATAPPDTCFYNGVDTCLLKAKINIQINFNDEKQVIHSFGASDCWTAKFIGKWANESKKNAIADYLFSMDTLADGSPKGIGLTQWRFNIGAGSYEQGTASGIPDEWRREECFLTNTGTYDWSKEQGAQWFLNAAKARNVKYTTGFAVSAPVYMTADGKAHGGGGKSFNLLPGKMDEYANFLTTVSNHFKFDYVSPFNEPQWNWGGTKASQEGTAATNVEIANLAKSLGPKLQAAGSHTKIILGEAAQLNFMTDPYDNGRGNQVTDWFSSSSANYIGNVPNVEKLISGHSYYTTCPDNNLISIRSALANKRNGVDPTLGIWQTEFGILGDVCGKYNGSPRNTSIEYGLYVAKIIHHDLVFANVNSWSWWLAISPYDYSDALVYINDAAGNINVNNSKTDGIVSDSRQLWCMGNFSRFIRPGMKRVAATINGIDDATAANTFMVSVYTDVVTKKIVIVIVNMGNTGKKFTLTGGGSPVTINGNRLNVFTTTSSKNLIRTVSYADNIIIEAKSVTTLTGTYN